MEGQEKFGGHAEDCSGKGNKMEGQMNKQQIAVQIGDEGELFMCQLTERGRTEEIEGPFEPWGDWVPFDSWDELVAAARAALETEG